MTVQQVTPELRQWIISQAQAGHNPEAVLQAMQTSGWQHDIALEALEATLSGFLSDHAKATDFLHPAVRIGDDPVPADQLRGNAAGIKKADAV